VSWTVSSILGRISRGSRRDEFDASSTRVSQHPYFDAGRTRIEAARTLLLEGRLVPALVLYREGILLLACAYLAMKPGEFKEPATPDEVIGELSAALEQNNVQPPPELATVREALVSIARLEFDRPEPNARALARALDTIAGWLSTLTRPHAPVATRRRLVVRLLLPPALLVAFVLIAVKWVFPPRNVARDARARSSSVAYGTVPEGVVNGDRYEKLAFHSNAEQGPWLSIDLAKPHTISSVRIYGRGDCCFEQSIPLTLEASNDGRRYRSVAERLTPFSQMEPWVVEPDSLRARYLRLTSRTPILVLSEIEVYGKPP
jgi:hypothetical protein